MNKYSFTEFLKTLGPFTLLIIGFVSGSISGIAAVVSTMHTEKHGCEYVEKAECKQVWVKK